MCLVATNDSVRLTEWACAIVRHIYKPGYFYAKAGVMLMDLQPVATEQLGLLLDADEPTSRPTLMAALDTVNTRWGRSAVKLASAGVAGKRRNWEMKQERKTPGYTTQWLGLITAD